MPTITVHVNDPADAPDYLREVARQLEEGFVSGHVTRGHYWQSETPKMEVLTVRHPDSNTTLTVFLDGVPFEGYAKEDVDPGAGHMLSDWRERIADVEADPNMSAAFKATVLESLTDYEDSKWIDDDIAEDDTH